MKIVTEKEETKLFHEAGRRLFKMTSTGEQRSSLRSRRNINS